MDDVATNDYHFITQWRVQGTREAVYAILNDAPGFKRWWPAVYLDVAEVEPGDHRGVGKIVRLHTRGRLPYTLRWSFQVTEAQHPTGFSLRAWGDFVGVGTWHFDQEGAWVNISFDWRIRADKPLLQYLSFLLKPLFAANHRWAMARGLEGLQRELSRSAAKQPPGSTGPTESSRLNRGR